MAQDAQKKAKEEDRRKSAAAAEDGKAKDAGKGGNKKQAEKTVKDPDPDGAELASVADPLEEASKLLLNLREHASSRLRTCTLSFEVIPCA